MTSSKNDCFYRRDENDDYIANALLRLSGKLGISAIYVVIQGQVRDKGSEVMRRDENDDYIANALLRLSENWEFSRILDA